MEFENITVTKQGVTKIDTITIIIPLQFSINKNIEITTTDRELIHIAINNHALLHDYSKNIDFVFDRILTILLKSNEVSHFGLNVELISLIFLVINFPCRLYTAIL